MPPVEEIATIVVCDGDQPTPDLLCEHLVEDRFKVLPAPSGTDALRLFRFNHTDLLILDLGLPDMPGIDVMQQIREGDRVDGRIAPKLPIIVLIGVGELLAVGAGVDVLMVVGLLRGARSASSAEVLVLAGALHVDPGTLLPERPCVANPALLGERGRR